MIVVLMMFVSGAEDSIQQGGSRILCNVTSAIYAGRSPEFGQAW